MSKVRKPKFKVGDKVRILDGSKIENYRGCFAWGMKEYIGKVLTIESVDCDGIDYGFCYGYRMKECGYIWDERGLELVDEHSNETIVIYRKDNTVIALDKRTGDKAIAVCHPEDKFDFNVGAKLAFERLVSCDDTEEEPLFKKGDLVVLDGAFMDGLPKGIRGTVVEYIDLDGTYVVDFHINYGVTHNCGILPTDTGLWIPYFLLKKVD